MEPEMEKESIENGHNNRFDIKINETPLPGCSVHGSTEDTIKCTLENIQGEQKRMFSECVTFHDFLFTENRLFIENVYEENCSVKMYRYNNECKTLLLDLKLLGSPQSMSPKVSSVRPLVKEKGKATIVVVKTTYAVSNSQTFMGYIGQFLDKSLMASINEASIVQRRFNESTIELEIFSATMARKMHKALVKIEGLTSNIKEENSNVWKDFTNLKSIMQSKTDSLLKKHSTKIDEICLKLESFPGKRTSYKEYEQVNIEIDSVIQKKDELESQADEFKIAVESIQKKLEDVENNKKLFTKAMLSKIELQFSRECHKFDASLPMYARRSKLLEIIRSNQITVVVAETGSGKSTQMAQYLYGAGYADSGVIACTQPRKVAAISLAQYVAKEMAAHVGDEVGYHVGTRNISNIHTGILFMTDHALLNECLKDKNLSKYSFIIIDEAHERSIFTDLLIAMVKRCLSQRKELKLIITSATIDESIFTKYFNNCPCVKVCGRTYPVDVIWQEDKSDETEYLKNAIEKAAEVHKDEPPGDILVFLTSPPEIEKACQLLEKKVSNKEKEKLFCLPLHGKLPPDEQQRVFQPPPQGKRKVVFATNVAETSVTIPGIKYVIDTGRVKERNYDHARNISSLDVSLISKSSADQRTGRAGRIESGKCFRLYSQQEYDEMRQVNQPEILRVHLGQALLKLLDMGISDPENFDFVESPPKDGFEKALHNLKELGAINAIDGSLTDDGRKMSKLSIEPRLAKIILQGIERNIEMESLIAVAISTLSDNIFFRVGSNEDKNKADIQKTKFCHNHGDIMTRIYIYKEWANIPENDKNKWCVKNCINAKAMRAARDVVKEIRETLRKELNFNLKSEFADDAVVDEEIPKILFHCYCNNLSMFSGHSKVGYQMVLENQMVQIHPNSSFLSLASCPQWVVFDQVLRTSRDFAINVTSIPSEVVEDGIEKGIVNFDIDGIKKMVLCPFLVLLLGRNLKTYLFSRTKGILNFKLLEEELSSKFCRTVLHIDSDRMQCVAYTTSEMSDRVTKHVNKAVEHVKCDKQNEIREFQLSQEVTSGVRIVLGCDGKVYNILLPNQYIQVRISDIPPRLSDVQLIDELAKYGEIASHKLSDKWAKVWYKHSDSAERAVSAYNPDNPEVLSEANIQSTCSFKVKPVKGKDGSYQLQTDFKVEIHVQWLRRGNKGMGFVVLKHEDDVNKCVFECNNMTIFGSHISVCRFKSKRDANIPDHSLERKLFIRGLPKDVAFYEMKQEVTRVMKEIIPSIEIEEIAVITDASFETTPEQVDTYREQLDRQIRTITDFQNFEIKIFHPQKHHIHYKGCLSFRISDEGMAVVEKLQNKVHMSGHVVALQQKHASTLFVKNAVMDVIREDIKALHVNTSTGSIKIEQKRSGDYILKIECEDNNFQELAKIKVFLNDMVSGDCIQVKDPVLVEALFSKTGIKLLRSKKLNIDVGAHIVIDNRLKQIRVCGSEVAKSKAKMLIDDFLNSVGDNKFEEISLKGNCIPKGLVKQILKTFGSDLQELMDITKSMSLGIDLHYHVLRFCGNDESLVKVKEQIKICSDALIRDTNILQKDPIDCAVCFEPVEGLYRLELCGHPYCKDCIIYLLQCSISSKTFPLTCAVEDCDKGICLDDITTIVNDSGSINMQGVIDAALSCFVSVKKNEYHYCITPDCPMVYKVTPINEGQTFMCPCCTKEICTSCHVAYHAGVSCHMYQGMKTNEDFSLDVYMKRHAKNTRLCPKCNTPIEKDGGCMRMTCFACKVHICWWCMRTFASSGETYDHLSRCGGIFE